MKRDHLNEAIIIFAFAIGIFIVALNLSGCRGSIPAMNTSFWAGDSDKGGITRSQDKKTISCGDPAFDEYVCLSYEDLQEIWAVMQQCKDWSNVQLMSSKGMKKFYKRNKQVVDHVLSSQKQSQ